MAQPGDGAVELAPGGRCRDSHAYRYADGAVDGIIAIDIQRGIVIARLIHFGHTRVKMDIHDLVTGVGRQGAGDWVFPQPGHIPASLQPEDAVVNDQVNIPSPVIAIGQEGVQRHHRTLGGDELVVGPVGDPGGTRIQIDHLPQIVAGSGHPLHDPM